MRRAGQENPGIVEASTAEERVLQKLYTPSVTTEERVNFFLKGQGLLRHMCTTRPVSWCSIGSLTPSLASAYIAAVEASERTDQHNRQALKSDSTSSSSSSSPTNDSLLSPILNNKEIHFVLNIVAVGRHCSFSQPSELVLYARGKLRISGALHQLSTLPANFFTTLTSPLSA